jgi:hypothetical protein
VSRRAIAWNGMQRNFQFQNKKLIVSEESNILTAEKQSAPVRPAFGVVVQFGVILSKPLLQSEGSGRAARCGVLFAPQ